MARKKLVVANIDSAVSEKVPSQKNVPIPRLFPTFHFKWMAFLVFLVAFGIYFNTTFNEYALDDGIVITENSFTKMGFSGIRDIFSQETFAPVTGVKAELSGGRYRPLSVATFAVEYQFFGLKPSISHLVNVLLYGFLCVLLFYFLQKFIFRDNMAAAFMASMLFAVHPVHTDVVSNIKGRDELLSLILLITCLIYYLEYSSKKKFILLFASLVAFFLSLLSKENGITFLAVIPLVLYFFSDKKLMPSVLSVFPFILVFGVYMYLRLSITGISESTTSEVMNAPFVLAVGDQVLATKIMIMGKYLWMLIFPHPLSYDYSYNQIAYVHFTDWKCILSILINGLLVFLAIKLFNRRHILSFAILFYYITLSIVSNFVFDVGSPFNERFLFQPSIGFAIAMAYLIYYVGTLKQHNVVLKTSAMLLFLFPVMAGGIKTILRNPEWKNNDSLFAADVIHAPNSAKTNNHAGISLLKQGQAEKDSIKKNKFFEAGIPFLKRALEIYPDYTDSHINLGVIYELQGKFDLAKESLLKAKAIYPDNSVLNINLTYCSQQYQAQAANYFAKNNMEEALKAANASLECNPNNVDMLYNLGGYYLNMRNVEKARELWTRALSIEPGNSTIKSWLDRISVPQPVK